MHYSPSKFNCIKRAAIFFEFFLLFQANTLYFTLFCSRSSRVFSLVTAGRAFGPIRSCASITMHNYNYVRMSDFALHILGEDNELRIGWGSSGEMTIRVEGERTSFSLCCGDTMEAFVFGWHKHCFTYKTNEYTKVCNIVYRLQ